ncbi:glycosyl transferase family 1 [Clostridium polyendosporum]|uniref:Glycosyl transferase family 1 n=1 Tax=Clostridium polyendosporum TaxID=69208 RepID=A0A919VE49_9CLOT|nr:glycosyltransferase [Clostridium polyendosporum]GIM28754.1 glycosyl transferase family 1 [Clostridium polyendosporum]
MKKRILHIINNNVYGGGETVILEIIRRLHNNYDFGYAALPNIVEEVSSTIGKFQVPYFQFEQCNPRSLKSIINSFNPDVIHAHGYRSSISSALACSGIPIISHLHNYHEWLSRINIDSIAYTVICPIYKRVVAVERRILEKSIFSSFIRGKAELLQNVIDIKRIYKLANESEYKDEYDFVFIGRITDRKDPLRFIEIMKKVHEVNSNVRAVMIGDGELLEECCKKIKVNNLSDTIKVTGYLRNPFPILKKAKVLVMTSKGEGMPMVALEALSLGKPVFASDTSGLNDVISNKEGAICRDDSEFIKHILMVLNDSNYYNEICQGALSYSSNVFNIDLYMSNIANLYKVSMK